MPLYPFKCKNCGDKRVLRFTIKEYENFNYICSACFGNLERVWSPPGVNIK